MPPLSSLTITLSSTTVPAMEIISTLLQAGWKVDTDGLIHFLPLGDKDAFAWTTRSVNDVQIVFDIMKKKEEAGEIIGLDLFWEDGCGFDILFHSREKISFLLDIYRKTLEEDPRLTDVNWYLIRIIAPLLSARIPIEFIEWDYI